nr:hypothetical protein [uncultured Mediterraneibacter sp.]
MEEARGDKMQPGRLSQAIWKKNIVHPLERANVCISEGTLSGVTRPTPFISDVTQVCLVGRSPATVTYGICRGINELAVFGTRAAGVDLHVELPEETEEDWIRQMTEALIGILQEQNLWIRNLDVRVNPTVKLPLFALSVMGVEKEENGRSETSDIKKQIESGVDYEILMVSGAGTEGILRILEEREEELSKRFVPAFLRQTKALKRELCATAQIETIRREDPKAVLHQVGEGGVFAALWNLLEPLGLGMEIRMDQILICQETVEISEFYRVNPYLMTSTGSFLILSACGDRLLFALEEMGARASKLGIATNVPARVILGQSEKRYLDRPLPDELMVWQNRSR